MFRKPQYTQVPNEVFDELLPTLKEGELRVLMIIMRQTFGWGNKEWDRISISQLMKKTGMERMAVIRATKTLIEKKLVSKHKKGPKGEEQCWYSLVFEELSEFSKPIEDSNNFNQYPKDAPPSILKIHTKETLTKEIKSPIVPKGDPASSSNPRKTVREEKKEMADRVTISPSQHQNLMKRANGDEKLVASWYDRLSSWKIGKEIFNGKNDYQTIVNWVIDAVKDSHLSNATQKDARDENDKSLAKKIEERCSIQISKGEITVGHNYIEFKFGMTAVHIKFGQSGFREQVLNGLRKMNLSTEGL